MEEDLKASLEKLAFDKYQAEREEIDKLIGKGFIIKTPIKSIFKFGRKFRTWSVDFVPLGLMDLQTDLFFQLQASEDKIYNENAEVRNTEMMNAVKNNALICAEIIAISILGKKWKIALFRKVLRNYLYWRINSRELMDFTMKIYKMNDYQNFISSIILLKAKRTTSPINQEKPQTEVIEAE